jgi:hypothetical protein
MDAEAWGVGAFQIGETACYNQFSVTIWGRASKSR